MTGGSDLRFNIARFRHRRPGATPGGSPDTVIDFDTTVPAQDLSISTARVPDGEPVAVVGELDAGISEFDVKARVSTTWEAECRRCLEPVTGVLELDVAATFVEGDLGEEAEVYPIEDDWIDVGAVVREEVLLALPLTPLCSGDCAGADPERFPTTGPVDGSADPPEADPRWAVLSELTFDED